MVDLKPRLRKILSSLRRINNFGREPGEHKIIGNRKGVALLMAVSALAVMTYIAMEVMYDSNVEYTVNSQSLSRLKAYYAAKSGVELSLLRVKVYQTVMNQLGKQAMQGGMQGYINQIWQFPFSWPLKLPTELSSVDKDQAKEQAGESLMDATFDTDIQDEGSRMDLSDLNSKSKTLRDATHKRLVDLFKNKVEADENFRNKYASTNFEELINNIADWMSDKNSSLNGGDKRGLYADLNKDKQYYPPNRAFLTLDEMHMVAGMTDEFFDMIAPQVTIYGMRGINPNVASKEVIQALDAGIDDRVWGEIEKRRSDPVAGPFKDKDDFWSFIQNPPAAARLVSRDFQNIPLYFDSLISFRIRVQGHYADSTREIVAIVTDLDRTASRIKEYVDKDAAQANPPAAGTNPAAPTNNTTKTTTTPNNPLPKGPPRIVYWSER